MKKIVFGVCLLSGFLFSQVATAQYKQGNKLLNLGIGLNSYYSGGIPLSASFEYGVTEDISVGGMLDYLSYNYGNYAGTNYNFTALYIGGRGSYHFNRLLNLRDQNWDIYGGASLGYRSFSWSDNTFNSNGLGGAYGSGVFLGIHAGAKYYFNPKFGAFGELGALGSTNVRIGVAFKF